MSGINLSVHGIVISGYTEYPFELSIFDHVLCPGCKSSPSIVRVQETTIGKVDEVYLILVTFGNPFCRYKRVPVCRYRELVSSLILFSLLECNINFGSELDRYPLQVLVGVRSSSSPYPYQSRTLSSLGFVQPMFVVTEHLVFI